MLWLRLLAAVAVAAASVEEQLQAGVAAYRAGDFEGAIAQLEAATRADPANDRAFAYLGNVLYRQGGGPFGQPSYSHATPAGGPNAAASGVGEYRRKACDSLWDWSTLPLAAST